MDLLDFLNSSEKPYQEGLRLYKKYRTNPSRDNFFNSVADAAPGTLHHNHLLHDLRKILRKLPASSKLVNAPKAKDIKPSKPNKPITGEKPTGERQSARFYNSEFVDVAKLSQEGKERYKRNSEITKKMGRLHIEMQDAENDEERKNIAIAVDALNKEKQDNWDIIKRELGKEHLPKPSDDEKKEETEKRKPSSKEILAADKRLKTVNININRVQREIDKGGLKEAKIKEKKLKIESWENEKVELLKILENA